MKLLDVGCGAGHYLKSIKERLNKTVDYIGLDATKYYIDLAKKAFPVNEFIVGDIFQYSVH